MAKKELYINYDIEGTFWELNGGSLTKVKTDLKDLKLEDELSVIINTYGGDIFEAISVRDFLHSLPNKKNITVSGICASAGTIILLSFDDVKITKNSFVMFHNAITECYGNKYDFEKRLKLLNQIDDELLKNCKEKLIKKVDNLEELIKNEWWLSANDFVSYFGGQLIENRDMENKAKVKNTLFKETMSKFEKLKNGGSTKRPFNLEKFKNFYKNESK